MRFSKSLHKSIAASLAFTMLTVPLAGCGSDRGLTTGGITGKGVLGDLAVGGFYGGVMGAFLGGEKLPEGAFTVELPRPNDDRLVVEAVGMDALRYYVHARICTEKLSRMKANNSKPEEFKKLLRRTIKLWEYADLYAKAAGKLASELAKKEKKPDYKPLAFIEPAASWVDPLFSVAHAKNTERYETGRTWKRGTKEWADKIMEEYKKYPSGQGISGMAKSFEVDTKTAKRAFLEAKQFLDQESGKTSQTVGQLYNIGTKAALVTKGACQVGLLIGGTILSGGATGAAAFAAAVNTVAAVADCTIEVWNIGHEVLYDETDPTLDKMKKYTGTISAITSGVSILTSFSNFALKGDKAVEITHETLKGAGLKNLTGYLDKYKIGGAGVAAVLDSSIWTVERGKELYDDGKFLGMQVIDRGDQPTAFVPQEVSQDTYRLPLPIEEASESEVNDLAWEVEGTYSREDAPAGIIEIDEREGDKKDSSAKDSGEASGEIADDSPYAPKFIIGATGSAKERRDQYLTTTGLPLPGGGTGTKREKIYTMVWDHHFEVVADNKEGQGFVIRDKIKITSDVQAGNSDLTETFQIVSYDSGTGEGKLQVQKKKIFPFKISGKPGSMTIEIEGFEFAPLTDNG